MKIKIVYVTNCNLNTIFTSSEYSKYRVIRKYAFWNSAIVEGWNGAEWKNILDLEMNQINEFLIE
jgi:hypothetical protein